MQRHALGTLFAVLAFALAAVSAYALAGGSNARRIIVGLAAAAIAVWFASLAAGVLRRRR